MRRKFLIGMRGRADAGLRGNGRQRVAVAQLRVRSRANVPVVGPSFADQTTAIFRSLDLISVKASR